MKIDKKMNLKNKILKIKEIIIQNPKKFYIYSMIILTISLIFNVWREIYYPPNYLSGMVQIPTIFSKSEKKIELLKKKQKESLDETKKILDELKQLGEKRKNNTLSKEDSIRVEFLMKKYDEINNGGTKEN